LHCFVDVFRPGSAENQNSGFLNSQARLLQSYGLLNKMEKLLSDLQSMSFRRICKTEQVKTEKAV
jgi:hypothetical protein